MIALVTWARQLFKYDLQGDATFVKLQSSVVRLVLCTRCKQTNSSSALTSFNIMYFYHYCLFNWFGVCTRSEAAFDECNFRFTFSFLVSITIMSCLFYKSTEACHISLNLSFRNSWRFQPLAMISSHRKTNFERKTARRLRSFLHIVIVL